MNEPRDVEVLLIEDNRTDADLTLRALIRNDPGSKVVWVKDGAEALDFMFGSNPLSRCQSRLPRLILLDLKLPRIDGMEVLRRLKTDPRTKTVPIVVLTASGDERDIARCYALGANSYLIKPVDLMQYSGVVAQAGLYWVGLNKTQDATSVATSH